jgi:hypothetical protein
LRKGESPLLPGEKRDEEEGTVGTDGIHQHKESFSSSSALKTYITPWKGRPRRFPPNNE